MRTGSAAAGPPPPPGAIVYLTKGTLYGQSGIEVRSRYLAALRGFFFGGGLCGVGGVFKNRVAMSSIDMGFGAVSRFGFASGIWEV